MCTCRMFFRIVSCELQHNGNHTGVNVRVYPKGPMLFRAVPAQSPSPAMQAVEGVSAIIRHGGRVQQEKKCEPPPTLFCHSKSRMEKLLCFECNTPSQCPSVETYLSPRKNTWNL